MATVTVGHTLTLCRRTSIGMHEGLFQCNLIFISSQCLFLIFHRAGLRAAGILLPLLGITWVFGLLAVNQGMLLYQLLFAFCSTVLGISIFIFYCILDSTVGSKI